MVGDSLSERTNSFICQVLSCVLFVSIQTNYPFAPLTYPSWDPPYSYEWFGYPSVTHPISENKKKYKKDSFVINNL